MLLDVIGVYSNPIRWESRLRLFREFEERMLHTRGVRFTAIECVYGDRPYELPCCRVHVRQREMLWNKENLINIAMTRLPDDWEYVAWVDADVTFRDEDWAQETLHELQLCTVLQPWTTCYDLGPRGQHLEAHTSFTSLWLSGAPIVQGPHHHGKPYKFAHPGYAWAARRRPLWHSGGLIETAILGAGDHHMALGLIGKAADTYPKNLLPSYKAPVDRWEMRAQMLSGFQRRIGVLPGTIEHHWHGPKADRKYVDRWAILERNNFNPEADLVRNEWGLWELAGNKPRLRHDIAQYFRQRNEDANA